MDFTDKVTGEGEPPNAIASELVLSDADFVPVTSTCCPMYWRSFILPVERSS